MGRAHQFSVEGAHAVLCEGLTVGNGLCFSPDGRVLYFTDTPTRRVMACDYDPESGRAAEPRLHIDTDALGSGVDGATVDAEGNLWATLIRMGEIGCFDAAGRLLRRLPASTDVPSSLAFGGAGMDRLFVTSISDTGTGRAVSSHPDGGHLFVFDSLGVRGIPEARVPARLP